MLMYLLLGDSGKVGDLTRPKHPASSVSLKASTSVRGGGATYPNSSAATEKETMAWPPSRPYSMVIQCTWPWANTPVRFIRTRSGGSAPLAAGLQCPANIYPSIRKHVTVLLIYETYGNHDPLRFGLSRKYYEHSRVAHSYTLIVRYRASCSCMLSSCFFF